MMAALVLCLAIALLGCGSKAKGPAAGKGGSEKATANEAGGAKGAKTGEKSPSKTPSKSAEKPAEKSKSAEKSAAAKPTQKSAEKPAPKVAAVSGGGSIRLINRGCVSFEPHWTTIRVGQSLTWHSELKTTVTIHVPAGAFERTEYVVPARGTVRSGPAQSPGDHGMWSMPAACQAAPIGVQGAGPGVTIEER